ncbi:PstS family phosphate ABC transporter substrate-binding protein [Mucilaginibacter gracilis]|nr:substrate-binding domain-containing protein [Mucilaginibacter gracilis]
MACKQKDKKFNVDDSYTIGKASFVADESLAPILDQELYVFKSLNKEAKPEIIYKSENDALRLFLNDSVRVAILARSVTPQEVKMFKQRALYPEINCFAYDAVTLIVNQSSNDTLTTVGEIKNMLNGKVGTDKNIVFDNANSSLIRYLRSFSGNDKFEQKNIYALKTNVDVIKYVSEHQHAVGFISYSWLLEPDKAYAPMVNKIKIVGVKDEGNKDYPNSYFKPDQGTLAMRQYPLVRSLYIINNTGRPGLGTGFASFVLGESGQRIVLRSGLLPDSIPTREVSFSK